jgi:serine/threonine protein kinase
MGEVYKARDTRLDRTIALKVLPPVLAGREDLRARFEREAPSVDNGVRVLKTCRVMPAVKRHWPSRKKH